jgi:intein/homing endonuclease
MKLVLEMPENCFIGGTLVHTKEGLRPIEEIKVGDYLLSKPEDGTGEPRYKRVTNTFRSEDKEVWYVDFVPKSVYEEVLRRGGEIEREHLCRLIATPNHPLWVRGIGWIRVDELVNTVRSLYGSKPVEFDLANGDVAVFDFAGPIKRRVGNSDHGWCLIPSGYNDRGFTIDLSQGGKSAEFCKAIPNKFGKILDENYPMDWTLPENAYRCTVYNLEVKDDHTYFVGTYGIWVHNCLTYHIVGVNQDDNSGQTTIKFETVPGNTSASRKN